MKLITKGFFAVVIVTALDNSFVKIEWAGKNGKAF